MEIDLGHGIRVHDGVRDYWNIYIACMGSVLELLHSEAFVGVVHLELTCTRAVADRRRRHARITAIAKRARSSPARSMLARPRSKCNVYPSWHDAGCG